MGRQTTAAPHVALAQQVGTKEEPQLQRVQVQQKDVPTGGYRPQQCESGQKQEKVGVENCHQKKRRAFLLLRCVLAQKGRSELKPHCFPQHHS